MAIGDDLIGMSIGFPSFARANQGISRQMMGMRAMRYMSPFYGDRTGMYNRMSMGRSSSGPNPFLAMQMAGGQGDAVPYMEMSQSPEGRQAADQYLGQFGMHALNPAQASPFAMFPNRGVYAAHPRLFGGLEGALYGAASTPNSDTWGEGIRGVAQGILGGHMARMNALAQQYAAPFHAAASMMPFLQDKQRAALQEAQIKHYNAMADYQAMLTRMKPEWEQSMEELKQQTEAQREHYENDVIPQMRSETDDLRRQLGEMSNDTRLRGQDLRLREHEQRVQDELNTIPRLQAQAVKLRLAGKVDQAKKIESAIAEVKPGQDVERYKADAANQYKAAMKQFTDPTQRLKLEGSLMIDPRFAQYKGPARAQAIKQYIDRQQGIVNDAYADYQTQFNPQDPYPFNAFLRDRVSAIEGQSQPQQTALPSTPKAPPRSNPSRSNPSVPTNPY